MEIKPCPFCGSEAVKGIYNGDQVSCPNCHVGIQIKLIGCQYALHENKSEYDGYEAVYQAIKIWNRRYENKELEISHLKLNLEKNVCTGCWLKNEKAIAEKIAKLSKLLEEAAEEIENLYGRETELSEEIRDLLN